MSTRSGEPRGSRSAAGLAAGLTLLTAVLLTGCADRATPVSETAPASATFSPAASPASGTSAGSARVDPEAADSIEDSVSEAETLLKELDQDFQGDAADVG